ncbi:MAG: SbcC/MukB-like Walker B domain-containing protein [Desulfuromonas sp.]|nr:SbcC/MukB-like Walker B domain-containing protein [Desulfuromonas sp.]
MKRLTKIILVQWYLFEAEEIPVAGHTAIVGANGAGKSSIIDGVQTVLCGGNKSISLNKGSNEKSSRSIREYCLGVVSDPNSTVRVEPRPSANTYIALCFYDDETDEHISAGISIWATATDPTETINGYFITRGAPLTVDDFTEDHNTGVVTLPWKRFREQLIRRFTLGKYDKDFYDGRANLLLPHKGPGDFTRQFYTIMSAEPGMPSNPQTLVKSLLAAIAFKPIADPTEFVRRNMLEPSLINIRELKTSLDFWKNLQEKATLTAKNIERLGMLETLCEKVTHAEADILLHEYTSLSARVEECYELASPAEVEKDDLQAEIEGLDANLLELEKEHKEREREHWEKEQDYIRQDSTQKIEKLKNLVNAIHGELVQVDNSITTRRAECLKLFKIVDSKARVPATLLAATENLLNMTQIDDGLLSAEWLKFPQEIDAAVKRLHDKYKGHGSGGQGYGEIQASIKHFWSRISPALKECEDRAKIIAQLENNESPLQRKTHGLIELLDKNRIRPEPLCDLIDVKDEAWRNTIEAVLGNIREALIVPPEQAREAIRLYRYEGKEFRGAHVVNTTKTEEWMGRCQKGSLAELVVTDNAHARAFINLRLGNIICVEKETELLQHQRAATADMMLTSGGVTSMMAEPSLLILGRSNREKQLVRLRKQQKIQKDELDMLQSKQQALSAAAGILDRFIEIYNSEFDFFSLKSAERDLKEKELKRQKAELALLENIDDSELKKVIKTLKETCTLLEDAIKQKKELRLEKEGSKGRLEEALAGHYKRAETLTQSLTFMLEGNPSFDTAAGADQLEKLRDKFSASENPYLDIITYIDKHLISRKNSLEKNRVAVIEGLQDFLSTYTPAAYLLHNEGIKFDTFAARHIFIRDEKLRLEDTTFANYAEQAKNALADVENIFRDKFISRLAEQLNEVKDNIAGLNKILKNRPFHGEYYQFKAKTAPELEAIYKLAQDFANDQTVVAAAGGLFDPTTDPNSPHRNAIIQIKNAFQDEDLGKVMQDYRNYFVYDVEMFNQEHQKVANLKHRIAKGSGGENMAPFYVAIGSSLASAYKIVSRPGRSAYGGMNLAPFDEAFSKLDGANIYNCIEFLKEINLQILLAAPDDKYTTLAGQVNTVVWVTRNGGNIELEIESLSDKTRELLQSDNPFRTTPAAEVVPNLEPV